MCIRPIPAYQRDPGGPVTLWPPIGANNLTLPCGNCDECLIKKATEWGIRGEHEARQWEHNTFITLTYNDEHLPPHGSLEPAHLERFIQALRNRARRHPDDIAGDRQHSIRYLTCGEYGSKRGRPHYHLLAFNCDFPDATRSGGRSDTPYYESRILDELWSDINGPLGRCNFGRVTPGAAATYMGKYATKGRQKHDRYDPETGELTQAKEFLRMSRRPIIGQGWVEKYANTDARHGFLVTSEGAKRPIPRAYRTAIARNDPGLAEEIMTRIERQRLARIPADMTQHPQHPDRREARSIILRQRLQAEEERRALQ